MGKKKAFLDGYRSNFETLKKACLSGHLAMMECQDATTLKKVAVLCAVGFNGTEYDMVPLARMFDGNPYEQLNPPTPNGGFMSQAEAWAKG